MTAIHAPREVIAEHERLERMCAHYKTQAEMWRDTALRSGDINGDWQRKCARLEAALKRLLAAHKDSAGFTPAMLTDKAVFKKFLENVDREVDLACKQAQAALEAK